MEAEPVNTELNVEKEAKEDTPLLKAKMWKYWRILKTARIEPAIVLHMIAFKMFYLNLQNIMLEQTCRVNLNYTSDICDNLRDRDTNNLTMEEERVQESVADIIRWKSLIDNFFPLIIVLFAGAWSDKYGRKFLILLPLFGYITQTMGALFCLSIPSVSANTVALISALPVALTGSIATINMAIFSYIADITPVESRTTRTGVTNVAFLVGMSTGNALGGFLSSTSLGTVGSLGIAGALDVFAFLWIAFIIKNDHGDSNKYEKQREGKTTCQIFMDSFNLKNVLDAAKAVARKREGNERLEIFMLIFACYFFITVPEYGEEAVYYLFLRYRLNWRGLEYGYYSTYRLLIGWIGGLLAVGLLSYKLKFSDPLIGIICSISQFSASFVYGFAKTSAMMYLGPAVDMWNSTMSLITKVIISKIVLTSEIGKVYSFMGCVDAVIPLIANPLYTTVYKATFANILPGLFFFMSAAMTIPPVCVYTWLFLSRKGMRNSKDGSQYIPSPGSGPSSPQDCSTEIEILRSPGNSKDYKQSSD